MSSTTNPTSPADVVIKCERFENRNPPSNKEYILYLVQTNHNKYIVYGMYGRYGSPNSYAEKEVTFDLARAHQAYAEEKANRYRKSYVLSANQPNSNQAPVVNSSTSHTSSPIPNTAPVSGPTLRGVKVKECGYLPQLLNEIKEEELQGLLDDNEHGLMQKFDGKRVMFGAERGKAPWLANRRGLILPTLSAELAKYAGELCESGNYSVFDAELIGEKLYTWSLLSHEKENSGLTHYSFIKRYELLIKLLRNKPNPFVIGATMAITPADKHKSFEILKAAGDDGLVEGVVFHKLDAVHIPGRPNSGGNAIKYKFWESASCIVAGVNSGVRSIELLVINKDGALKSVGNATIPPNYSIPEVGDVVEIKYLYAYKDGSLFLPQYKGTRDDIATEECTEDKIKYKIT